MSTWPQRHGKLGYTVPCSHQTPGQYMPQVKQFGYTCCCWIAFSTLLVVPHGNQGRLTGIRWRSVHLPARNSKSIRGVRGEFLSPVDKGVLEKHPCDTFTNLIAEPAPEINYAKRWIWKKRYIWETVKKEKLFFLRTRRVYLEKRPPSIIRAKDFPHISFFCSL